MKTAPGWCIELSDPVNLRAFTLANPDRVVVDMPEVPGGWARRRGPSGFGSVKSYRYGLFREGNSRMVIDLNRPVTVSRRRWCCRPPPASAIGW